MPPAKKKSKRKPPKKLTAKEKVFVAAYVVHLNARRAAEVAGYEEAGKHANAILNKPHVQKAVQQAVAKRLDEINVQADSVLRELAHIAFGNINEVVSIEAITELLGEPLYKYNSEDECYEEVDDERRDHLVSVLDSKYWNRRHQAMIVGIEQDSKGAIKIKRADKMKALEMLAKYLKLLGADTKVDINENNFILMPADIPEDDEWQKIALEDRKRSLAKAQRVLNRKLPNPN